MGHLNAVEPLLPILSAFLWRFKGMAHSWGTQTNRLLCWVLPVGLLMTDFCWLHNIPIWLAGISALLTWGGISIGHSKWENDSVRSFWGMSWITWVRMTATVAPLLWFYPQLIVLTATALLTWPACWLGYKLNDYGLRLSTFGFVWCNPQAGSEWEEWFIGLLPYGVLFVCLV